MFQHEDYKVGWICALPKERTAAVAMLDERHEGLSQLEADHNAYTLGSIGEHNVVIACLPKGKYGTIPAATAATNMTRTFPAIRFALMVGIGGGAHPDVRLGDVVISVPQDDHPGVVQWDMGKTEHGGTFRRTGALNNPPTLLLTALSLLESDEELGDSKIPQYLEELGINHPKLKEKYIKSDRLKDVLFEQGYSHEGEAADCENCAQDHIVKRAPKEFTIHYGTIASGNQVIKDATFRDSLVKDIGGNVLCIEMEAAGLMNNFPCLIIRGICDYADSHKNEAWQEHAAAVAAACAKELLRHVMADKVGAERAAKEVLSQINQTVTIISEATRETQQILKKKDDMDVLNWLSPNHYGSEQSEALKRWHPETCQWFLGSKEYRKWLKTDGRTLYCPGIPGAGKTTLSAAVIHDISQHPPANTTLGLAYVYFIFSRQREQTIEHVLATLLVQFLQREPSLPDFVRELNRRHSMNATSPTRKELSDALRRTVSTCDRAYVVLDALDECTTDNRCRKEILSDIFDLQISNGVNIFATSRIHEEIASIFNHRNAPTSSLPIRAQDGDVSIFLHHQLEAQDADIFDNSIRKLVISKVTQVSEGMFLLARLHINTLVGIPTKRKIKTALEGLAVGPDGLHDVYEQTMDRIQSQRQGRKDIAKLILLWIVHARRPLSARELQHALGLEPGSLEVDKDDIPSLKTLKSVCAGLVQIDEGSSKVGLIHYTTQEYFEKTRGKWFPGAQRHITQTCVAYLSFPSLSGYCDNEQEFKRRHEKYPFYGYAAREWGHHARTISAEPKVMDFLKRREVFKGSVQALMRGETWHYFFSIQKFPRGMNGLHLAAFFGLREVARELLPVFNINDVDTYCQTPLAVAASRGHSNLVKLFIKTGNADINVVDAFGTTPLVAAARKGHLKAVEFLLRAGGLGVNAGTEQGTTALLAAAERGHWKMVQMIIEYRAVDVNEMDHEGQTALLAAAKGGHSNVVKLLIKTGNVNINVADAFGTTALLAAAERGHWRVVGALLTAGENYVNVMDYQGKTALLAATQKGCWKAVKLLIETRDVDINIPDAFGRTALTIAAKQGHSDIIQLLIKVRNVDVNVVDGYGRTPLCWAYKHNYTDAAKLLMKTGGTDINCPDQITVNNDN